MEALDLWEVMEGDYEIPQLPNNPILAHIKLHKDKKLKKSKAKACLFAAYPTVFTHIMSIKIENEIWGFLKCEYEGDERIEGMQVLNLVKRISVVENKEVGNK